MRPSGSATENLVNFFDLAMNYLEFLIGCLIKLEAAKVEAHERPSNLQGEEGGAGKQAPGQKALVDDLKLDLASLDAVIVSLPSGKISKGQTAA